MSFPYVPGASLKLDVADVETSRWRRAGAVVVRVVQPCNDACVMEVYYYTVKAERRHAILKLYDWRHSGQVGQYAAERQHMAEIQTYRRLSSLQGSQVPRCFGDVRYHCPKLTSIRGILLECVEGYTFENLGVRVPQSRWQEYVDQAVGVVMAVDERDILNVDVAACNFMVRTDASGAQSDVVILDFGHCRLRHPDEPDGDWVHVKSIYDGEYAICRDMDTILDGEITYRNSALYNCICHDCSAQNTAEDAAETNGFA